MRFVSVGLGLFWNISKIFYMTLLLICVYLSKPLEIKSFFSFSSLTNNSFYFFTSLDEVSWAFSIRFSCALLTLSLKGSGLNRLWIWGVDENYCCLKSVGREHSLALIIFSSEELRLIAGLFLRLISSIYLIINSFLIRMDE